MDGGRAAAGRGVVEAPDDAPRQAKGASWLALGLRKQRTPLPGSKAPPEDPAAALRRARLSRSVKVVEGRTRCVAHAAVACPDAARYAALCFQPTDCLPILKALSSSTSMTRLSTLTGMPEPLSEPLRRSGARSASADASPSSAARGCGQSMSGTWGASRSSCCCRCASRMPCFHIAAGWPAMRDGRG